MDEAFLDVTALVQADLEKEGPIDLMKKIDWDGVAFVGMSPLSLIRSSLVIFQMFFRLLFLSIGLTAGAHLG